MLQALGGPGLWGYERAAIEAGQAWRLLTSQFVHLNATHLALNLGGLAGVMAVFGPSLTRPSILIGAVMGSACTVALGLWFLAPDVAWYAGASGVLHGLFAAGVVVATGAPTPLRAAAALGLGLKLAWEARHGTASADLIGAPVIHAAHLYGATGGLLGAALVRLARRLRSGP